MSAGIHQFLNPSGILFKIITGTMFSRIKIFIVIKIILRIIATICLVTLPIYALCQEKNDTIYPPSYDYNQMIVKCVELIYPTDWNAGPCIVDKETTGVCVSKEFRYLPGLVRAGVASDKEQIMRIVKHIPTPVIVRNNFIISVNTIHSEKNYVIYFNKKSYDILFTPLIYSIGMKYIGGCYYNEIGEEYVFLIRWSNEGYKLYYRVMLKS